MKKLFSALLLSLTITGASYAMDNSVENKTQEDGSAEDLFFQANIVKLNTPIAAFINDFKTWPKEEQEKIKTFTGGWAFEGRPAAADKYEGRIGYYIDCRLTQRQVAPFVALINHLKQQK